MRKLLFGILMVFMGTAGFSQFDLSVNLAEGYQVNIFNNPDRYEKKDISLTTDSLYANSLYTDITANFKYRKKWKRETLSVKGYVGGAYYNTASEAHKYKYKLEVSYRTRYADGRYLEVAPQMARIRKNGLDQTETILRTPYSYQKFVLPFNFDFYLGNKAWLKIQPAYLFKKYDTHAPEKLYYHSWYVNAEFKKKWDTEQIRHGFSFVADVSSRFYSDFELPKDDFLMDTIEFGDLTHKTRQWNYYIVGAEYSVKTQNDIFRASIPVKYVYKEDKLGNMLSYSEFLAGLTFGVKYKSVKFNQAISYSNRDYLKFLIEESTKLKYNYLRLASKLSYELNDHFEFDVQAKLVDRKSNRIDVSKKFYRGYFTYFVELGVKLSL